jgi:UDP-N-acetyl-D-galactosamine dehydrogenase
MVTYESLKNRTDKIGVIGLGYVGLPLAVHLSKHFQVVGFDLKAERVQELSRGHDRTLEVADEQLQQTDILFTDAAETLAECRLLIVAVPTPIDEFRIPDLGPLRSAATIVGTHLQAGACVVFESTVYPGATEDVCVPVLEKTSGLTLGESFVVGYSPERINPGDKVHTVDNIIKIVSGSDTATRKMLARVYGSIVNAGIYEAASIKVAEAAKVIENTQRDLNIALMNELALIFDRLGIDTLDVLEAAGTKWNFLPFRPGLVGGHCIGVDPYYLTFKAESVGYHPEIILAGRRINDSMGKTIAERVVKMLINAGKMVNGAKVAVLGLTFKEDVPDLRNTKVIDIIDELKDYHVEVLVNDPLADRTEAKRYYGLDLKDMGDITNMDAIILAVAHDAYIAEGIDNLSQRCSSESAPIIADIKGVFTVAEARKKDITYWRL